MMVRSPTEPLRRRRKVSIISHITGCSTFYQRSFLLAGGRWARSASCLWLIALLALPALATGCAASGSSSLAGLPQTTPSRPVSTYGPSAQQLAATFLSDIQHRQYQAAYQLCGALYTRNVTAVQFAAQWRQRDASAGPIVHFTVGRVVEDQLTAAVIVFVQRAREPSPPPSGAIFMTQGPTAWQIIRFTGI